MLTLRDCMADPNTLNAGQVSFLGADDTIRVGMLFKASLVIDRDQVVDLVAFLQAWLGLKIPDRRPLLFGDTSIICPYCDRSWDLPKGRKAGFVMAGIYRHYETCPMQLITVDPQQTQTDLEARAGKDPANV